MLETKESEKHSNSESESDENSKRNDDDFMCVEDERYCRTESLTNSLLLKSEKGKFMTFFTQFRAAFKLTKGLLTGCGYILLLTFVVYPGVCVAMPLSFFSNDASSLAWKFLILSTSFNVLDSAGRILAGLTCMNLSRTKTLILTYLRTLQVLLFFLMLFKDDRIVPSFLQL